jgi:hypothetical protein
VLAGIPVNYEEPDKLMSSALDTDPSTVQSSISEYLCNQVYQAIVFVNEAKINSDIDQVLELRMHSFVQ